MAAEGDIDPDLALDLTLAFTVWEGGDLDMVPVGETTIQRCGDRLADLGLALPLRPLSLIATLTGLTAFSARCLLCDLELGLLLFLEPGEAYLGPMTVGLGSLLQLGLLTVTAVATV